MKNKTKEEIVDFFQEYVFGYIFNDINNCIKARANYVVALSLLTYTEFLGGLINGKLGLDGWSRKNFNKGLSYFPRKNEYTKANKVIIGYKINSKRKQKKGLYEIFRCGLAHEYFIKGKQFTCVWNNPNGDIADHIGIKIEKGQLIFYNNEYFRDYKEAVNKLYKELIVKEDKKQIRNFSSALKRLESRKLL